MLFFTCLISAFLLINNVPALQAQTCNFEINTDYFGTDLTYVFVTDQIACCNLCNFYPGCKSFTFVTVTNACWLKSLDTITSYSSPGRISGIRSNSTATTIAATTTTVAATTTTVAATTTTAAATITLTVPTTTVAAATTTAVTTPTTTTVAATTTVSTTTVATTTKNYGCFIENNINYIGNDLSSSYVNSLGDCCNLCGATTGCVVWSYWSTYKFCYLKNALPSVAQRQDFTDMFSGIITLN